MSGTFGNMDKLNPSFLNRGEECTEKIPKSSILEAGVVPVLHDFRNSSNLGKLGCSLLNHGNDKQHTT